MLRREVEGNEIKSRASHIPGGGRLLHGGWARSRGWQQRATGGPGNAGLTPSLAACEDVESPWSPGWAWGGAWASLLPETTSGFFPPAHPGWRGAAGRGGLGECPHPLCSRSIRRRDRRRDSPAPQELRSAAALDQSPRRSSPWQPQHQARPPSGALAAKSPTRRRAPAPRPALGTCKSVPKMHALPRSLR